MTEHTERVDLDAARKLAAEAQARADAASRGPWVVHDTIFGGLPVGTFLAGYDQDTDKDYTVNIAAHGAYSRSTAQTDAAFIAAARQDVPALAVLVERMAGELRQARATNADLVEKGIAQAEAVVSLATRQSIAELKFVIDEQAERLTAAEARERELREAIAGVPEWIDDETSNGYCWFCRSQIEDGHDSTCIRLTLAGRTKDGE
jgi:hypothetical protein